MVHKVQKNFKIAHLNVRSLTASFVDFCDLVNADNFDFIGISETWLSNKIASADVGLNGYNLFRMDRPDERRGGGVGFYVNC